MMLLLFRWLRSSWERTCPLRVLSSTCAHVRLFMDHSIHSISTPDALHGPCGPRRFSSEYGVWRKRHQITEIEKLTDRLCSLGRFFVQDGKLIHSFFLELLNEKLVPFPHYVSSSTHSSRAQADETDQCEKAGDSENNFNDSKRRQRIEADL
uniref:Uncharacterized protein n=1 Tax=Ditylenchus dipsaci TaxID=166011 RepID=A0A915D6I2_9BILA